MNPIILSDEFTIYKGKYSGKYSVEEFLKFADLNDKLAIHTNNNSVWMEIDAQCFRSVNDYIKSMLETITGRQLLNYANHFWIYTQSKGFNMEWMHQHIQVHPPGRSNILSDFTFTFYLQTTDEVEGDEGCIVFEDEDKKRHRFFPEVGDIFIFPGDLRHTAVPTPTSEKKRIVYAGSFCIDVENQKTPKKKVL